MKLQIGLENRYYYENQISGRLKYVAISTKNYQTLNWGRLFFPNSFSFHERKCNHIWRIMMNSCFSPSFLKKNKTRELFAWISECSFMFLIISMSKIFEEKILNREKKKNHTHTHSWVIKFKGNMNLCSSSKCVFTFFINFILQNIFMYRVMAIAFFLLYAHFVWCIWISAGNWPFPLRAHSKSQVNGIKCDENKGLTFGKCTW